ncbi:hypothetical protein QWF21_16295 [Alkalimonas sp. MEB004]|uniref:Uncharacterized protein n=1 Tax=Alkalimonas mucilaginosa TaxID=3057676 RepID=A0ABU7JJE1_9GAMM|nr:hypothetical protein [Alkalimonas sp. MEB004]MEE2025800.1 hypothetical protein [Alkalimonas sp. MEB004]
MDSLLLVSLFNAGIVAVAILGYLLLYPTPAYRGVCLLLVMVITAAVINVLEDQHLSRDWHLISPVFVLGFGPALYPLRGSSSRPMVFCTIASLTRLAYSGESWAI